MPLQVNEKEKHGLIGKETTCPMEMSGWSFKQSRIGEDDVMSVAINGHDVILVEDVGTPYQALKPIHGDFGVVAKLMHDGEKWLEKHRNTEAGLNMGYSIWLEWKYSCHNAVMNIEEFFETYFTQDSSPASPVI